MFGGIGEYEIKAYGDAYEAYRTAVEGYPETLHERLANIARLPRIAFQIENVGQVSMMQLVVGIASDDYGLLADDSQVEAAAGSAEPPAPPERPLDRQEQIMRPISSHLRLSGLPGPSNPIDMRWLDRPSFGANAGTYGCEDFRPGRRYHDVVHLSPRTSQCDGHFEVTASANDLAQLTTSLSVLIEQRPAEWMDLSVTRLLPRVIRVGMGLEG